MTNNWGTLTGKTSRVALEEGGVFGRVRRGPRQLDPPPRKMKPEYTVRGDLNNKPDIIRGNTTPKDGQKATRNDDDLAITARGGSQ